jgi:glycerol kinase
MPAANVRDGLLSSVVHWSEAQGAQYCLEATVNGAGVAIDYMAKQLGIEGDKQLEQSLAVSQRMPLFINTISGLGSPDWRSDMGAFFVGDEHCSNQLRLAAVAESIIFLIMRNLECMRRHKLLSRIVVSGGLSNSDQLCQRLSDLSGLAVVRSESAEASARGAAYLLLGCPEGWANNGQTFHSQENKALAQRFTVWTDCLETSLG